MDSEQANTNGKWEFWIDRGGTFTDLVVKSPEGSLTTRKYLSVNPESYDDAAIYGIRQAMGLPDADPIPGGDIAAIKMGTTVATNALLERKGEPTVFVTTRGFRDVIEIGYQARPDTFALDIKKPELLYGDVVEIDERVRADGTVELPVDISHARKAMQAAFDNGFRSVAIALIHSYKFPEHEQQLIEIAREIGFTQISASHEVTPLTKIVSRAETTVVDAYLTPILRSYVDQVSGAFAPGQEPDQLLFMQSSGGLIDAASFRGRDAILSGPAGGIVGCVQSASQAGFDKVIGFDMGGTSTDVSHYSGELEKVYETEVAGVRMRVPMLHIHTVAAGGGSILKYEDGRFRVGPQSAGADPGPACYRRGGPLAVTDINVCLGKLKPEFFPQIFGSGQDQPLDREASRSGFAAIANSIADGRSAEDVAEGFLEIAVEHMAQAIKKISTARGHDVKNYALNCFGGAGGQHACLVAERLGMRTIMLHPFSGVLSAYGMGLASTQVERQRVIGKELHHSIEGEMAACVRELSRSGAAELSEQGVEPSDISERAVALLRYAGTDTTLTVPVAEAVTMREDFEEAHQRQYGFTAKEKAVLLDTLIVESRAGGAHPANGIVGQQAGEPAQPVAETEFFAKGAWHSAPVFEIEHLAVGQGVQGPAIIVEETGTIIVEPGWSGTIDRHGHLILTANDQAFDSRSVSLEADPVTLEIFNNLFRSIAEQMGIILRNTSQSVNVKERLDFSCAIFDAEGALVANAPHVPVHLGSMDATVRTVIDSGQSIEPGDVFVQNNPHNGGSHLPDITVVSPVFDKAGEAILFYVASRAHHEDVGGISPGSMSPYGRTIHEEGIVLDNLKLVERGEFQTARIEQALSAGDYPARNIPQNIADLMAQVAANAAGASELRQLVASYSLPVVQAYMQHIQDNAEASVRRLLKTLKSGEFSVNLDSGAVIAVAISVDQEAASATIDFTGTSAQLDSAFNAPQAVTKAAVLYVMRCLVADEIPLNSGCMKPLKIIVPEGSMLNPVYPAAVVAGNVETSQAITDALFAALGRLGSGQGTMNNLTFGNDRYQYYETICSGAPAGPGFDGAHAVHTHMTNTRMTDPEILEARYPVVLDDFSIDRGSGGKGQWNAGDGITRTIRFLEEMECSILSERRRIAPFGLMGGQDGRLGRNRVEHADGTVDDVGGSGQTIVRAGDRIVIQSPTGGGFGPVSKRVVSKKAGEPSNQ
ncbi:hydantoinase B/oxoprolinase family protein [Erythrobacter sp. F6033]|uniref:hydantoinase B/oxoprolinase family protein n=1 Tax=Erythrobacter sp. F6033 TaxID=2926401 RepID=UPI001FF49955|nr:hydantoinase B/oxoprolinase family protein [Erythrobacter sp. F6033]MCK0127644.1 hydantoinase B/oxoprolinase family protein [Erythrobacter sp. F6033]